MRRKPPQTVVYDPIWEILLSQADPNRRALTQLAGAVRRLREQRGMTRSELAAALGLEEARVGALEAGRLDPDYALLLALARALDVRLVELASQIEQLAREEEGDHP